MFLETSNTPAITLIGSPSAQRSLRISAQSSTDNTLSPWLDDAVEAVLVGPR
jgi:hypothetical protein